MEKGRHVFFNFTFPKRKEQNLPKKRKEKNKSDETKSISHCFMG